jgi:hypothetical protein
LVKDPQGVIDTCHKTRFSVAPMRFRSLLVLSVVSLALFAGCATQPQPVRLETVNVLPLELNENFQIRKIKRFFNEPTEFEQTESEAANFERRYYAWGAVDTAEALERRGNYYDIFWRTRETADVTVRFEYRQLGLGNFVSGQELYYPGARGSYRSQFRVTGDEYLEFGRVSAWRVLLIVDGRIVAFRQSFAWR